MHRAGRGTVAYFWLIVVIVLVYYWKFTLTRQFSLLIDWEQVSQAYSWHNFWVQTVSSGHLPLWDPYTYFGHSFIGEMQTGAFYPLNLLLLLAPSNRDGMFSPQLFHYAFILSHLAAAWTMYGLARELGRSRFAALVAGTCFSLGGYVARIAWPHMLGTCVWLPAVVLLVIRAMQPDRSAKNRACHAILAGNLLGLAALAGGLHMSIMQAIVVSTLAIYLAFAQKRESTSSSYLWALGVVSIVGIVAFAAAAIQLLPSAEYSRDSIRFGVDGGFPAAQKILYNGLSQGVYPHGLLSLVSFHGTIGEGETANPYMGVIPLALCIIAVWRCWHVAIVRYATVLAVCGLMYAMGHYSLFHGIAYATVPYLWLAREAGRFVYLTSFGMAILVAFGIDVLASAVHAERDWAKASTVLKWSGFICASPLLVLALFGKPEISPWTSFSLMMLILSAAILHRVVARGLSGGLRFLLVALILWDLNALDWLPVNKAEAAKTDRDHLKRLLQAKEAAHFLRTQPGHFRVLVDAPDPPNIGDVFGAYTDKGAGVTLHNFYQTAAARLDMMNVEYVLRPASSAEPSPIYQDQHWKVYKRADALPRAWIVHRIIQDSHDKVVRAVETRAVDLRTTALVERPLALQAPADALTNESVRFISYSPDVIRAQATAATASLLIFSEMYDPGWRVQVNGQAAELLRVDGVLRGVPIPAGSSSVTMTYRPASVTIGATFGALAVLASTFSAYQLIRDRRRSERAATERSSSVNA